MKPLGLGEDGGISITREDGSYAAYVRYRDFAGRRRRIKRRGRSKAEAPRNMLKAVKDALRPQADAEFTARNTLENRKTVATLLEQSGASARMVTDQLGHSRVSMTQDV